MTALAVATLAALAFVRGGIAYTSGLDGAHPVPVGPALGVALGGEGAVYLSRRTARPGACDLYRAGRRAPVLRFAEVRPARATRGLCELATDPRAAPATELSGRSYRVDVGSRRLRLLAPGVQPAFAPDGKAMVVVHSRALLLGTPGRPASFRRITPAPEAASYRHPAFSPQGTFLTAARCTRTCVVVLGRPGGTLRAIWRPQSAGPVEVRGLAWLDRSTLLLHLAWLDARAGNLFRLRVGSRLLERVASGITGFAVRTIR